MEEESLIEKFDKILTNARIYEYGKYPVKGCGIWLPYGFELRQNVLKIVREILYRTGHKEVLLPMLIPKDMLEKEAKHIAGFLEQVYWVTKGGTTKLDVELALRPTSETAMTHVFKDMISSYRDLPLKVFQIVSIFRYETEATRPMIRVREVTTFKEAFTFHESKEDALKQFQEAYSIYSEIFDKLGIPYITPERPSWDRFPGAEITVTFDTILPDGKTLQIGSIHYLAQSFSKVFDAKFMKKDGSYDWLYMLSYGISERVIASLIIHYADDIGAVLLPSIAPIKIVVMPIFYEEYRQEILNYAREIKDAIELAGYNVVIDDDPDKTPGEKFYEWERIGVPLRIEIGPKEVKELKVTLTDRLRRKKTVEKEKMFKEIKNMLNSLEIELREKIRNEMFKRILKVKAANELGKVLDEKKVAMFSICSDEKCGMKVDELVKGAKFIGYDVKNKEKGNCIVCGKETDKIGYLARKY
jgi:prolyl-tRNA synthetase